MGHLFILQGDLTKLACDAWLLPTDKIGKVESGWRSSPTVHRALGSRQVLDLGAGWGDQARSRVLPTTGGPAVWATDVVTVSPSIPGYVAAVGEFLQNAGRALADVPPANGRATPLLGLPLVATGSGGQFARKGGVAEKLVAHLLDFVSSSSADVVLVLDDPLKSAAAQRVRWRIARQMSIEPWADLPANLVAVSDDLSAHAALGRLVVFFGAGPSMAAGLPGWQGLVGLLAADAGLKQDEISQLRELDLRDQAMVIQSSMTRHKLVSALAGHLAASEYSLLHGLLANLPVDEFVTTNFDTLFEQAWRSAGSDFAILPDRPSAKVRKWILKLHGSVGDRDDIVLTRADYFASSRQRAALAGIVQALLITRHMLFVGYSLNDEDFHQIVQDVRSALVSRTEQSSSFGTALLREPAAALRQLWKSDINVVSASDEGGGGAAAARLIEILLDRVIAIAQMSDANYLMDPSYRELLSESEKDLADQIALLGKSAAQGDSAAHRAVRRFLNDLGDPS